ncbi:MAG: YifB family Mg chelatase-like AAA ATPase [Paludibacteraceae bacterium]|nr:YifB family Mg chelatase-like AAA ATPase [Paludibacteraceae bacterium]
MLAKIYAAAVQGVGATLITIEAKQSMGVRFYLVGLPDNAVKESRERIMSALQHNKIPTPKKQVVINMAPADIKKEGASYDLPLAIGILAANETVKTDLLEQYIIMGELSLDGSLHPVKGVLPIAIMAKERGFKGCILPKENCREAAVIEDLEVFGAENLVEVIDFLNGVGELDRVTVDLDKEFNSQTETFDIDFSDVKGQDSVKRAMEVAAAGGHNIIMVGPPGAGKSMMAKRMPTILPPLTIPEAVETTKIHSVAGKIEGNVSLIAQRPFRSPHHTISDVALVGGGTYPQPGEISLAHNGVLFLDELPEFKRTALEVLRQPLEDRKISISRAMSAIDYPASFTLVASMNPCPCGYYTHPTRPCTCTTGAVRRYLSKISGPLLDRIDIQIEIIPVPFEQLAELQPAESSAEIRKRVVKAREIQAERFKNVPGVYCNAQMNSRMIRIFAQPDAEGLQLLKQAMLRFNLSARAYDRILKVARTIADLDGAAQINSDHISEAVGYRNLDREGWAG